MTEAKAGTVNDVDDDARRRFVLDLTDVRAEAIRLRLALDGFFAKWDLTENAATELKAIAVATNNIECKLLNLSIRAVDIFGVAEAQPVASAAETASPKLH